MLVRERAEDEELALEAGDPLRPEAEHADDLAPEQLLTRVVRDLRARAAHPARAEVDRELPRGPSRLRELLHGDDPPDREVEPLELLPRGRHAESLAAACEDVLVSRPVRLVTSVELEEAGDPQEQHFSALHEAVLEDGRRVTLLDDRGWGGRAFRFDGSATHAIAAAEAWSFVIREEIEREARTVVGPDEPFDGRSQKDMEDDHWAHLAGVLRAHGISIEPAELRRLPHEVVLGERLRAALDRSR